MDGRLIALITLRGKGVVFVSVARHAHRAGGC
jgi:hypothetical protein